MKPGVNLSLTISGHHFDLLDTRARAGTVTAFGLMAIFDLSVWWSKRHVCRQPALKGKSAFRIHLDDCRRLHRRLADGGCDYLDLLLVEQHFWGRGLRHYNNNRRPKFRKLHS